MDQRGFTLMEILIAIAITMVLAGVGLTSFNFSLQKSRDAERKSDLELIGKAIHTYAGDFGGFPDDDGSGAIMGCYVSGQANQECVPGQAFSVVLAGETIVYLSKLPTDPNGNYIYYYVKDGESGFSLFSVLENTRDSSYNADAGDDYGPGTIFCGSGTLCNYEYSEGGVR